MKQRDKDIVALGIIASIALVVAILYILNLTHDYVGEYRARRTVEKYLNAQKKGDFDYSDLMSHEMNSSKRISSFNILDSKYLNTLVKQKDVPFIRKSELDSYDAEDYELFKEYYKSLKDFLDSRQKLYDTKNVININDGKPPPYIIYRGEDSLSIYWQDTKKEYLFLYDVTLTNRLGSVLHKRFTFIVDDDGYKSKYRIADFDYPGLSDELD